MRKYYAAVFLVLGLAGFVWYAWSQAPEQQSCETNPLLTKTTVSAHGHQLQAEVVTKEVDKIQGLSDRHCLEEGRAMLFVYDLPGDYCFWMKGMHFPIDMLWLDQDKKIVTIHPNVSPDTYDRRKSPEDNSFASFCPERPAQYILETNAGVAKRFGWELGSTLSF